MCPKVQGEFAHEHMNDVVMRSFVSKFVSRLWKLNLDQ